MRTDAKQSRLTAAGANGAAAWPSACQFNRAAGQVRTGYSLGRIEPVVAQGNLWAPEGMLGKDNQIQE
jgi:hypothetical protein